MRDGLYLTGPQRRKKMTLTDIKNSQKRCVESLVGEFIHALRLTSYADVYEHDEAIERLTRQRTSLLPPRIAEIIDFMVMDALYLQFRNVSNIYNLTTGELI